MKLHEILDLQTDELYTTNCRETQLYAYGYSNKKPISLVEYSLYINRPEMENLNICRIVHLPPSFDGLT